jgi:hypothetical protein
MMMSEEQEAYNAWLVQQEAEKFYRQAEGAIDHVQSLQEDLGECQEQLGMAKELLQELLATFEHFSRDVNWGESFLEANTILMINEVPVRVRKFLEGK